MFGSRFSLNPQMNLLFWQQLKVCMQKEKVSNSWVLARDVFSWLGAVAIVFAYFALTMDLLGENSWGYAVLNLTGAVAVLIGAYYKQDYQPVFLNIVWALIALYSLFISHI